MIKKFVKCLQSKILKHVILLFNVMSRTLFRLSLDLHGRNVLYINDEVNW